MVIVIHSTEDSTPVRSGTSKDILTQICRNGLVIRRREIAYTASHALVRCYTVLVTFSAAGFVWDTPPRSAPRSVAKFVIPVF
jgi:hypothetical protein